MVTSIPTPVLQTQTTSEPIPSTSANSDVNQNIATSSEPHLYNIDFLSSFS